MSGVATVYTDIRKTIESHFATQWALVANEGVNIFNVNSAKQPPENKPWVRIRVRYSTATRVVLTGLASTGEEQVGFVEVELCVPIDTGEGLIDRLADLVCGIFREQRINITAGNPIVFGNPEVNEIPEDGSGQSTVYMKVVTCSFDHTDFS